MPVRALLVDDNAVARMILSQMMEGLGHEVVAETESLTETIEAYKAHKPNLVLLDLSLVLDDGLTILKSLRNLDPQATVVIVSGNPQQKMRDDTLAAGARAFLNKPFNVKELTAVLASLGPSA